MDCSTKAVAELIGNIEEKVIKNYSHLYKAKMQQSIEKLNSYLDFVP